MSGTGQPTLTSIDAAQLRVVVVAAEWHATVMDGLIAGAERALSEANVAEYRVVRVPGSFELPIVSQRVASDGADAVVALGVVVRGGTPHFDYVCDAVTAGLTRVALDTGVPVGFGVLTCDTEEQALDRAGLEGSKEDKGYDATHAALSTALTLAALRP
ncbi:MAG TPA: 6,7-dimethyl-8-ribityllumazine synthase [Nocardioidaceae bacterium]|jgi:6,7-dimethyl-8-ribityllumazine synthase